MKAPKSIVVGFIVLAVVSVVGMPFLLSRIEFDIDPKMMVSAALLIMTLIISIIAVIIVQIWIRALKQNGLSIKWLWLSAFLLVSTNIVLATLFAGIGDLILMILTGSPSIMYGYVLTPTMFGPWIGLGNGFTLALMSFDVYERTDQNPPADQTPE